MQITISADCHINKNTYSSVKDRIFTHLPFRTVDHQNAFKNLIDKTIELKSDLVVLIGDIFDDDKPSEELSGFFNSQLKKLRDSKIPIIIMSGNHDFNKKSHALLPLRELELAYAKVIDKPTILPFKDYLLMLFPYSIDIENGTETTKNLFFKFLEESKLKIEEHKDKKLMFFGHFGVAGASINQVIEKQSGLMDGNLSKRLMKSNYRNTNEEDIYVSDLDDIGAEYVFLGDYHRHQILPTEKCKAMYTGSIERSDFSEIGQKKGFILYNDSFEDHKKMGKCKFVEYKNCREFIEIRGALNDILESIKSYSAKHKDPVVKVVFVGNSSQYIEYSSHLSKIKDKIKEKINPIHIDFQQEIESEEYVEEEEKIMEDPAAFKIDVVDIISEIIADLEQDKKEYEILSQMGKDIYKEAKGES